MARELSSTRTETFTKEIGSTTSAMAMVSTPAATEVSMTAIGKMTLSKARALKLGRRGPSTQDSTRRARNKG